METASRRQGTVLRLLSKGTGDEEPSPSAQAVAFSGNDQVRIRSSYDMMYLLKPDDAGQALYDVISDTSSETGQLSERKLRWVR